MEITTRLIYPPPETGARDHGNASGDSDKTKAETAETGNKSATTPEVGVPLGLSASRLSVHNSIESSKGNGKPLPPPPPLEQIVVHIEVTDTGVGIRARDLVDLRLFSPYVQTEIGRHQGGKGTGLGLALIRHIVKVCHPLEFIGSLFGLFISTFFGS